MEKASVKRCFWEDVRSKLATINPILVATIDEISPNKRFPLYMARYPYGCTIVSEGAFKIPSPSGQVINIEDYQIDTKMRDELTYSGAGVPAGVVLDNTVHEAITSSQQTLPLGVVQPGSIFALWKKLDQEPSFHPINMFTMTAGARFIFMVPNISNLALHNSLKKDFKVKLPPPKNLLDQWEIFKSIVNSHQSQCNWATELLFFSKQWFEKIKFDPAWKKLYLLMLESAWRKSGYERNNMFYALAFSKAQANRNLKPNPYLVDTVKHLFAVAAGVVPGFSPAVNNSCAPVSLLQRAYIDSYGLQYIPTIFLPKHFSIDKENKPVYYTLSLPTTLEFSPKSRKISSTISNLSEIKHVINILLNEIKKNKLKVENTILGKIANSVAFDFFHNKLDAHGEIRPSSSLAGDDFDLIYCEHRVEGMRFSDSGAPVRGCIRLMRKKPLI